MTHNQIAYWNYVESQRANKAKEFETARSNRAQEALLSRQHDETFRHNLANEGLQARQNDETRRHNLIGEALTSQVNSETARANRAQESLKWAGHNLATNQFFEQQRMNTFNKSIAQQEADAKTLTADTGRVQAKINYLNVLRQMKADDYNVINNAITNLNSLFKINSMSGKGGK